MSSDNLMTDLQNIKTTATKLLNLVFICGTRFELLAYAIK